MKTSMTLFLAILAFSPAYCQTEKQAPLWHPVEFEFKTEKEFKNPFDDRFAAKLTGPGGETLTLPGFYDGNGTWKVRAMGTALGNWTIETESDVPELNGKTAKFTCVEKTNPRVHGRLRVDSENPYHFVYEDGTRCFLMGYECDWVWALDMKEKETPTLDSFLDKLAGFGFNHIILNGYAHDTSWRKGTTGGDDFGPPPMFAWEGTNKKPDHSRFNLAYWKHYDRVIDALYQRGIEAHLMIKVYNKKVKWPKRLSEEDDLYFRWLIARYSAYPNIVWDFSKESYNEKDVDYKLNRLAFVRNHDPYRHLITVHDDDKTYTAGRYDDLLDFWSDQNHKGWHEKIAHQRKRKEWPVVNVEFGYEHGPEGTEDKTYRVVQSGEENVRRAWEICMAGGHPAYYYTYTAWDVIRPEDTPVGYSLFSRLKSFFEGTGYWKMTPADHLIQAGYCLANEGKEYIYYFPKGGETEIEIPETERKFSGYWFHPYTGEKVEVSKMIAGKHRMTPPSNWDGAPAVLHLRVVR